MDCGPVDLAVGILPVLLAAIWAVSWWRGTRRFRLWFALLSPVACIAGLILALIGSASQADHGDVQRWADSFDSPSASTAWLGASSLLALGVALLLTVLTLIVEYILLVRRDSRAARARRER